VYWAHEFRKPRRQYHRIYAGADAVIATNSAIVEDLRAAYPGGPRATALTYNPIPREYLDTGSDRPTSRRALNLPSDTPLVVYTGKLGKGLKELDYILEASRLLPRYTFVLTGGKPASVEDFRRRCDLEGIDNVIFTGFLTGPSEVRAYQLAADVLVSYYSASDHAVDYNFPQKLTEYMASGNVIVTPMFRATNDVIGPHNAIVVLPDDPASLAAGIRTAIDQPDRARALAKQALSDVRALTLEQRSEAVVSLLRQLRRERVEVPGTTSPR
jgi:glycosyltransferase involved in cell wall biosynthesis